MSKGRSEIQLPRLICYCCLFIGLYLYMIATAGIVCASQYDVFRCLECDRADCKAVENFNRMSEKQKELWHQDHFEKGDFLWFESYCSNKSSQPKQGIEPLPEPSYDPDPKPGLPTSPGDSGDPSFVGTLVVLGGIGAAVVLIGGAAVVLIKVLGGGTGAASAKAAGAGPWAAAASQAATGPWGEGQSNVSAESHGEAPQPQPGEHFADASGLGGPADNPHTHFESPRDGCRPY